MTIRHARGVTEVVFTGLESAFGSLPSGSIVVTDDNVRTAWGHVAEGLPIHSIPPGERSKSISRYAALLSSFAAAGANRSSTVVAFGGGVVGDLAGFAAATYMRGVRCIQVPTSLMAMIDSAIGGKTGIDLDEGKNLVGAFHQPERIYVCLEALSTLPQREMRSGLAEAVKYGMVLDPLVLDRLTDTEWLVARCVELKAAVVEEDEFETKGRRAVLNFGHTVGHAIEQLTGYGEVLHGEAVAIGMVVESKLGEVLGESEGGLSTRLATILAGMGLPTYHNCLAQHERLINVMRRDKKGLGDFAFSLVAQPGECKLVRGVPPAAIEEALKACSS